MTKLIFAFSNFAKATKKVLKTITYLKCFSAVIIFFVTRFYGVGIFYEIMQPESYRFMDHKRNYYLACPISYRNFVTFLKTLL